MTASHVLEQLPLWVGGDLVEADAAMVQAHLERCPDCRAAAQSLAESRAWLLEDAVPPFTAEDRMRLRAEVMAQIRTGNPRRLRAWPRLLLAVAALGWLLLTLDTPRPVPLTEAHRPEPTAHAVAAPDPPASPIPVRRVRRSPVPAVSTDFSEPALARIELQTDNPNIRIIWLARSTAPVAPSDERVNPS